MSPDKLLVINHLRQEGVVAVLRASDPDQAVRMAAACIRGGITSIEVAFTTRRADKAIELLATHYPDACIGAGTVLDAETARIATLSGAQFVVSPSLNEEAIRFCNRYRIAYLPGAMTVSEVVRAMELGCDLIKLFPGELYGPQIIKAIRGPLPQAYLMPTGGVSIGNVGDWIRAGAAAVGIGGSLIGSGDDGDKSGIENRARAFVNEVQRVRAEMWGHSVAAEGSQPSAQGVV